MAKTQSAAERYYNIFKYHGMIRGARRVYEQITQIDLYDWVNSTNTREILSGNDFVSALGGANAASAMPYQPVYTDSVRTPLMHCVRNHPVVGASSACFMDLGCGRAKSLHVARSMMQHLTLIGVDIHPELVLDSAKNLGFSVSGELDVIENEIGKFYIDEPKVKILCNNVNDVDYEALLKPYDVFIVFNKNSFDKNTTQFTLENIKKAAKGKFFFYIYNNPVFSILLEDYECVFEMKGWHKNWNTKVYKVV